MFENKFMFFLFILIPFIITIFILEIISYKKRAKIIAGSNVDKIMAYYSENRNYLKMIVYIIAFVFVILALARPKWGIETVEASFKGRDILIILDTSYSMAVKDISPSRLDSAKFAIEELLKSENGDRIGLMVFSGSAELLVPITTDYSSIAFFLESVYPDMLDKDGTNISNALLSGLSSFQDDEPRNKMILLITDGEDLQGEYYSTLNKIKDAAIKIFTVGVGTKNGEPIPMKNNKGEIEGYMKDQSGNYVISKLDEKRLVEIAEATNSSYMRMTGNKNDLRKFVESIDSVEKQENSKEKYEQKKEHYNIFLIPALILFAIGFILGEGKFFSRLRKTSFLSLMFYLMKTFLIISILFSSHFLYSNEPKDNKTDMSNDIKKDRIIKDDLNGGFFGNREFKKGNYTKALQKYSTADSILKENDLAKLYYNTGNSYYKLEQFDKAKENFDNALLFAKDDNLKSQIYYNQGLNYFRQQNYSQSKKMFKESLLINENDDNARYNYEVVSILEKKQQEQQKDQQQNNNEQENNEINEKDKEDMLKALEDKEKNENREQAEKNSQKKSGRSKYW